MPLPEFITKIFSGGASDIISSVGGVIDNLTLSKEEKEKLKISLLQETNKQMQAMQALAIQETESYLKDMDSARAREIAIATAEHAPIITKVVAPILALIVVISTLLIWALILFRHYEPKNSESMIIGALTAICGGVINYYFGSSASSASKQKQLDSMQNKTP